MKGTQDSFSQFLEIEAAYHKIINQKEINKLI